MIDPIWRSKRALVVEDEAMVAMLIEDSLVEMGCIVTATASTLESALSLASAAAIDFAVLDLNLSGLLSFPVADVLSTRGVPFIFSTGYGAVALPRRFRQVPAIGKPFHPVELEAALSRALAA